VCAEVVYEASRFPRFALRRCLDIFGCRTTATKIWHIGILETSPLALNASNMEAFRAGMRAFGYVEGQNLVLDYRSADGRADRFPELAAELVHLNCDLILTRGTPAVIAANRRPPAAVGLGVKAQLVDVRKLEDLVPAFRNVLEQNADALIVENDGLIHANRELITGLAAKHKIPAMYSTRELADAGGLLSYSVDCTHLYFRAASFVDKLFKGAKPSDLPVEQPTRFDLVVNLKAAKSINFTFSKSFLLRADQIIE
jgi:ABC-type uncharacterized transport system substrate-binding protein